MPARWERTPSFFSPDTRVIAEDWFGHLLEKSTPSGKVDFADIKAEVAKTVKVQVPQDITTQLGFENPEVQWWKIKNLLVDFYFAVPKDFPPDIQAALATIELSSRSISGQSKDEISPELLTTGVSYNVATRKLTEPVLGYKEPVFLRFSGAFDKRAIGIEYILSLGEKPASAISISLGEDEGFRRFKRAPVPTPIKFAYKTTGLITKAMQEKADNHTRSVLFSLDFMFGDPIVDYPSGNCLLYDSLERSGTVKLYNSHEVVFKMSLPPQLPQVK